jgi:RNA recognition motif-containing protein
MIRIFVGGLPLTAVKDDVVKLFRQFGATDEGTVLPRDRRTRRKKGFAYVELPTSDAAVAAIAVFDGFVIGAKALTVTRAEDRPQRKPRPPRPRVGA